MKIEIKVDVDTVGNVLKYYGKRGEDLTWKQVERLVKLFFESRAYDALDADKEREHEQIS